MAFNREEVGALLVKCGRRCCICHRFCGSKIETDHMDPHADSHNDDIENAIPVCFECHADIHAYNDRHPRGRKYTAEELRGHKAAWLKICEQNPAAIMGASHNVDVGPIEALLNELDFNASVGAFPRDRGSNPEVPPPFVTTHFVDAMRNGALTSIDAEVKKALHDAYSAIAHANQQSAYALQQPFDKSGADATLQKANRAVDKAVELSRAAVEKLKAYLGYTAR